MPQVARAAAVFSNLYRANVWLFLRVIPHRLGIYILPSLYLAYLACWYFSPPAVSFTRHSKVADHAVDEAPIPGKKKEPNGNGSAVVVVAPPPNSYSPLTTILFSLPSPFRRDQLINFAINFLLFNFALDFVTYPVLDAAHDVVFTRVGAVYPDSAKIVVRYPQINATEGVVQVVWRQAKGDAQAENYLWRDGPVVTLRETDDWTTTTKLGGLWPSTSYEYRLTDAQKLMLPYPSAPIPLRTFPDPRIPSGSHFRFVFSSCATPNFPYLPFHGRTIRGFDLLADYLWPPVVEKPAAPPAAALSAEELHLAKVAPTAENDTANAAPAPPAGTAVVEPAVSPPPPPPTEFMLFLGDFFYADVPVYWGDDEEAYRRGYRRNYASPSLRKVYERLPMFHVYDDHEIINNFAGLNNDSTPPFPNASAAYTVYNSIPNFDPVIQGEHFYDFRYGDSAFFVMDTRRYRSDVFTEDVPSRTMLGDVQLARLYEWLGKVNNTATFKFIVSSVPFTSLWSYEGQIDTWAGFLHERDALLNVLHTVPNVVVLSGDRHEFAAIEFTPPDARGHRVLEVSTSPISMFYVPFIRTLGKQSKAVVQRTRTWVNVTAEGVEETVEEVEEIPQERVIKYIATGNHKWSAIEVDTRDANRPVAKLEMVADGKVSYNLEIAGTPVKMRSSTALGAFVPQTFVDILGKIGLSPAKWF